MTNFVAGLYRLPFATDANASSTELADEQAKSAFLYVNSGLGTIGIPVRLGVPPEITLITLRATG
jgi:predicted MPP superfamily phosphohydrolase